MSMGRMTAGIVVAICGLLSLSATADAGAQSMTRFLATVTAITPDPSGVWIDVSVRKPDGHRYEVALRAAQEHRSLRPGTLVAVVGVNRGRIHRKESQRVTRLPLVRARSIAVVEPPGYDQIQPARYRVRDDRPYYPHVHSVWPWVLLGTIIYLGVEYGHGHYRYHGSYHYRHH